MRPREKRSERARDTEDEAENELHGTATLSTHRDRGRNSEILVLSLSSQKAALDTRSVRIGVMGAGSIGCYVGGRILAASAADVVLIGRQWLHDELGEHGLTTIRLDEERHVPAERVTVATSAESLSDCDAVLVAVKSAHTEGVARELAQILREDCVVVSLQNGLRNAPTLREHLGSRTVVAAVVGFNVVSKGEGVFHNGMTGPLQLERTGARVADVFRASELETELHDDLAPHQWTKLLVNLNNAVSALSGAPTVELLKRPGYRKIVAAIIDEASSVLKAAGIRPAALRGVPVGIMPTVLRMPTFIVRLVTSAQMKVDPEARSSMWEDLQRGRKTEVDHLNGEIVDLADRLGVEAPLNAKIVELVRDAERHEGSPNLGPDALWSAISS